jgi:serine/threonine-protein kinase RsbW
MTTATYEFRIRSDVPYLEKVRLWAANIARHLGFDERGVFEIEISVYEACANVVEHAYRNAPGRFIDLALKVGDGKLTIVIEDEGGVFEAAALRPKDIAGMIASEQNGGLGLFILEACMDEILYRRHGGRNILELSKYLPSAAPRRGTSHGART